MLTLFKSILNKLEIYRNNWIISLHPRNLNQFTKTFKTMFLEGDNIILRSSSELFMELGLSNNNNIILPLIDIIVENNLPNREKLV